MLPIFRRPANRESGFDAREVFFLVLYVDSKKKAEHYARPSPTGRYEETRPRAVRLHELKLGFPVLSIKGE